MAKMKDKMLDKSKGKNNQNVPKEREDSVMSRIFPDSNHTVSFEETRVTEEHDGDGNIVAKTEVTQRGWRRKYI